MGRRKQGRGGENGTRSNICETMRWAVEAEEENFFLFRREFIALTRDSRTFRREREKSFFSQFLSSRFPSAFYPPSLSPLPSTNWQRWERNGITLTQTNGEEKSKQNSPIDWYFFLHTWEANSSTISIYFFKKTIRRISKR